METSRFCNDALYKEVAEELDLTTSKVREVVTAHSKFIAEEIKSGKLENFYIPYFGKIKVRVKYVQWVNQLGIEKGKPRP